MYIHIERDSSPDAVLAEAEMDPGGMGSPGGGGPGGAWWGRVAGELQPIRRDSPWTPGLEAIFYFFLPLLKIFQR